MSIYHLPPIKGTRNNIWYGRCTILPPTIMEVENSQSSWETSWPSPRNDVWKGERVPLVSPKTDPPQESTKIWHQPINIMHFYSEKIPELDHSFKASNSKIFQTKQSHFHPIPWSPSHPQGIELRRLQHLLIHTPATAQHHLEILWMEKIPSNYLGCIKTLVYNGISTTNLNWWRPDFFHQQYWNPKTFSH